MAYRKQVAARRLLRGWLALWTLFLASIRINAQDKESLRLVQTIPMPNVKGRIDHLDVDVKGKRLFVAGLENGSVEVISGSSLANGRRTRCLRENFVPQRQSDLDHEVPFRALLG